MSRYLLFCLFIFLVVFSLMDANAANLEVNATSVASTVISELDNPAVFDLSINNLGASEMYEIYSLVGVVMEPKEPFLLNNGTNLLRVNANPVKEVREKPMYYQFEYQLKGKNSGISKHSLTIKIVSLKDAISINANKVYPNESESIVVIKNLEDTTISGLQVHLKSVFFDQVINVSLASGEEKEINVQVDLNGIRRLKAGEYDLTGIVEVDGKDIKIPGKVSYLEKEGISVSRQKSGIIVRKEIITKTNEGNVPVIATVDINKDIISRLFTSYSIEPGKTEREAFGIDYHWEKTISPGESSVLVVTTNYTFPFVLIILVVLIIVLVRIYSISDLSIKKRVSYVKTKGGEFALKVVLHVKARKHVNKIKLVDKLPGMAQLYEKYGRMPDHIDHVNNRLSWNIDHLNAGEERVFSYIFYSKLRAVGNFELPNAFAIYEREGISREAKSNKTFFMSETGNAE